MLRVATLVLLALSFSSAAWTQSLGEIARKERERREKNRERGVEVREYTEEEVSGDEQAPSEPGEEVAAETDPQAGETSQTESSPSLFPESIDESPAPATAPDLERERRDRRREEAEWRARIGRARERVALARERREALDGLFLVEGERYVDVNGKTVIESLDHLRRLVREAEEELEAAERALEELREEARRARVPPGWLR